MNAPDREAIQVVHASEDADVRRDPLYVLQLTLEFEPEDDVWCGHCVELGTAAYAGTREQARAELVDAVLLQLDGVEQLHELEAYLVQNSVRVYTTDLEALRQSKFAEMVPA